MKSDINFLGYCAQQEFADTDFQLERKKKEADSLPAISDFIKRPLEVKYCDFDFEFVLFCDVNKIFKNANH